MHIFKRLTATAALSLLPLVAACGDDSQAFTVDIAKPLATVYQGFADMRARGSDLRDQQFRGLNVKRSLPADSQILYEIPASDGRAGSTIQLSFLANETGGTRVSVAVDVPELAVAGFGAAGNKVIDDAVVASNLKRSVEAMGTALEARRSLAGPARNFNNVLDTVSILSDSKLTQRAERMMGAGMQNALAGAGQDDESSVEETAAGDPMYDPAEDAQRAAEAHIALSESDQF